MQKNPRTGNHILLVGLGVSAAILSIILDWGIITITAADLQSEIKEEGMGGLFGNTMSAMLSGASLPVNGHNFSLVLGNASMPVWIACAAAIIALLISSLNYFGFTSLPKGLLLGLNAFAGLSALFGIFRLAQHGSVGIGAFFLLAAVGCGLFTILQKPQDQISTSRSPSFRTS